MTTPREHKGLPSSPPSEGVPAIERQRDELGQALGSLLFAADRISAECTCPGGCAGDREYGPKFQRAIDNARAVLKSMEVPAPAASPQSEAASGKPECKGCDWAFTSRPCATCPDPDRWHRLKEGAAAPRPGKPTAVEVGQRWRADADANPYTVIAQVADGAGWLLRWDDGAEAKFYEDPVILRDEYLGMAAPAPEGPPADAVFGNEWDCRRCGVRLVGHQGENAGHVAPVALGGPRNPCEARPAAAPGAPEMTLTFAEALRLCGERGVVEVLEPGVDHWREFWIDQPYGPHLNMDLTRVAQLAEAQFRRKPKLPVPPPVQRSRVRELAEAFAKEKGWTAPAWVEHCNEVGERVAQMAADWIREAEGNGVADDFLAFTRGRLGSAQGGGK